MSETATEEKIDVDLSADVACEILAEPQVCANEAKWIAKLRCCGMTAPCCDPHKHQLEQQISAIIMMYAIQLKTPSCRACGGEFGYPIWRPL